LYLHGAGAFQLLHAGIELKVFEALYGTASNLESIANSSKLKVEPAKSLVFGLTSMGLLARVGDNYKNCGAIEELFSSNEWDLFCAMVEIQAHIMYLGQIDFVDSLKKNRNVWVGRFKGKGNTIYEKLSNDPKLKQIFYEYMGKYSAYAIPHLIKKVDFSTDRSLLDVGGGNGENAIQLVKNNPNLSITLLDLGVAKKLAEKNIRANKMSDRILFSKGDMFKGKFPKWQDTVLFIHQLVIWSPEQNEILVKKVFDALKDGGRIIIFSSMANDEEDGPLMAGLDTVYFRAVAAGRGKIYSYKYYEDLLKKIGFGKTEMIKCDTWTPHGIVIGIKKKAAAR